MHGTKKTLYLRVEPVQAILPGEKVQHSLMVVLVPQVGTLAYYVVYIVDCTMCSVQFAMCSVQFAAEMSPD